MDIKKTEKWVIGIDLDGTLLNKKDKLSQKTVDVIKRLNHEGHIVSIITGRPYRSSKHVYEQLGLSTIMANHNGAILHNPSDEGFISNETGINRSIIYQITDEDIFKNNVENFAIETKKNLYIGKHDKWLEEFFFIGGELKVTLVPNIEESSSALQVDPYSMLILLKEDISKDELTRSIIKLKTKYGESLLFRYWQHPDISNQIVLEVNPISTDKGHALRKIRNHYNVQPHHTIVYGDGLNDIPMFKESKHSIVMKNAVIQIRFFGTSITCDSNNEDGVANHLEKWFFE